MSDETLPAGVSEMLRNGINAEITKLMAMPTTKKSMVCSRDEILDSIEYLEKHGTACTTTLVRRRLAELDLMIREMRES